MYVYKIIYHIYICTNSIHTYMDIYILIGYKYSFSSVQFSDEYLARYFKWTEFNAGH